MVHIYIYIVEWDSNRVFAIVGVPTEFKWEKKRSHNNIGRRVFLIVHNVLKTQDDSEN